MKNKRGQIFSIWLVFITMMMIGSVIMIFYFQQQSVQSLIISPMGILSERDALDIFEDKEINLIRTSLESATGNFESEQFQNSFRSNFVDGIMSNDDMKEFLFGNLSIDDVKIRDRDKNRNLIENGIYPKIQSEFKDGEFIFTRVSISKDYLMKHTDKEKNSFPLGFSFKFERKYLITMFDGKYNVRKL